MESGVDVLAHAPSKVDGVDDVLLNTMVDHHMAMIPTLKLFSGSNHIERIREIVARFHALGGTLLFGTDTGFLTDYDVKEEYRQLGLAGLSFHDVSLCLRPPQLPSLRFQRIQARSEPAMMEILRFCLQIRLRENCRISAASHIRSVPDG